LTIAQSNALDADIAAEKIADLEDQIKININLSIIKSSFEEAINKFNSHYQEYLASSDVQNHFTNDSQKVIDSIKKLKDEVDRINELVKNQITKNSGRHYSSEI